MQSIEAYKKLLLRVNKNDTNTDIDISKGEFVLLYNEEKNKWLSEHIAKTKNTSDVRDVSELLVKHLPLVKNREDDMCDIFSLPINYFDYISSYSYCSADGCKKILVRNFEFKPANENTLLENTNFEPSLEYEETIVDLSENQLFVYKKDFSIDEVFLSYYRFPINIDIEGYRKLDGTPSISVDPDMSDQFVEQILDRCAIEIIRRYENPEGFQLAQNRLQEDQ